jgi:four helix bundle protein
MDERKERLKERTRAFALRVIRLYSTLPKSPAPQVFGLQILRAATSVGAHYAESCRSRSKPDFVSKIEVAMQELEETDYWLYLLEDAGYVPKKKLLALHHEISELLAIFVVMVKNSRAHLST